MEIDPSLLEGDTGEGHPRDEADTPLLGVFPDLPVTSQHIHHLVIDGHRVLRLVDEMLGKGEGYAVVCLIPGGEGATTAVAGPQMVTDFAHPVRMATGTDWRLSLAW